MKAIYSASRMIFSEPLVERLKQIDGVDLYVHIDHGKPPECDISEIEYAFNSSIFKYHDIKDFTSLKQIQLFSAGTDRVPMEQAKALGITIKRATDVYSIPIAEFVLMRVLEIYKHSRYFESIQKRKQSDKDKALFELNGKTAGIIGYGSIGREIAKRLKAFDVTTIGFSRSEKQDAYLDRHCVMDKLYDEIGQCDMVILSVPYTDALNKFFGDRFFTLMKDNSVFINVARGMLVDEAALINHIKNKKFMGVALDVTYEEPLSADSELWTMDNVFLSPHNSFMSDHIYDRLFARCYDNLKDYISLKNKMVTD